MHKFICSCCCILILLSIFAYAETPGRVISLSPAITEIVYELDKWETLVGVTSFCDYPAKVRTLPKVGGYFAKTINIEAILLLKPDVVLCENAAHSELKSVLDGFHINYLFVDAQNYGDIYKNIEVIGRTLDAEDKAAELIAELHAVENNLQSREVIGKNRPRVYWEIWNEPLMAAGKDSFIGKCIELAGGINIFSDSYGQWPQISSESLIIRDPDVIILGSTNNGGVSVKTLKARPGWDSISAVNNNRVYTVDENIFSRPTPRTIRNCLDLNELFFIQDSD